MSIYASRYVQAETTAMENCLCGENGRSRNEKECARRKGCAGCGFDRDEYQRRVAVLRSGGLRRVPEDRMQDMATGWGVNTHLELYSLQLEKKR